MTKNELAINNWVRHRDQGEKPYRITSITIDGDKYLYTAEGLTAGDAFVDARAAVFEPIAINEEILYACGYIQMINPIEPNVVRTDKYFNMSSGVGGGSIIEMSKSGHYTVSMSGSGGQSSFLFRKVKYLHELQNLCKAFDNTIVDVNWSHRLNEATDSIIKMDADEIPVVCN